MFFFFKLWPVQEATMQKKTPLHTTQHYYNTLLHTLHITLHNKKTNQLLFGILDQTMHTSPKVDTAALYGEISKRVYGITPQPNTNMVASFNHLMGGYDAQYYGLRKKKERERERDKQIFFLVERGREQERRNGRLFGPIFFFFWDRSQKTKNFFNPSSWARFRFILFFLPRRSLRTF